MAENEKDERVQFTGRDLSETTEAAYQLNDVTLRAWLGLADRDESGSVTGQLPGRPRDTESVPRQTEGTSPRIEPYRENLDPRHAGETVGHEAQPRPIVEPENSRSRREPHREESQPREAGEPISHDAQPPRSLRAHDVLAEISSYLPSEETSREETIRQLRVFANNRTQSGYVPAEVAIALSLAGQLEKGATNIDLSQRYWTADPAAAEERHRKALENLRPALREAERHAQTLDYGRAIAHGMKKGEVLAVVGEDGGRNTQRDIGRGLGRTAGVLARAGSHGRHMVQAPRLSLDESVGGGL